MFLFVFFGTFFTFFIFFAFQVVFLQMFSSQYSSIAIIIIGRFNGREKLR